MRLVLPALSCCRSLKALLNALVKTLTALVTRPSCAAALLNRFFAIQAHMRARHSYWQFFFFCACSSSARGGRCRISRASSRPSRPQKAPTLERARQIMMFFRFTSSRPTGGRRQANISGNTRLRRRRFVKLLWRPLLIDLRPISFSSFKLCMLDVVC